MAFAPISPLTIDGLNKFLSMAYHQFINHAIYTFADLRIADQLRHAPSDRGFTSEEIIARDGRQWNSQLLDRVLRACVSGGIVQSINDDKHFILTSSGMMMTSDHPSHTRDLILFIFGPLINGAYQQLPSIVRDEGTGSGVARISDGLDLYTLLKQPDQKELLSIFSGAMIPFSMQLDTKLVVNVDYGRFQTIVDIGGNQGTFLAQILENYPNIHHGIVFDLVGVVNQCKAGEEFTSREISKDRWSFVSGDMFDSSTIPLSDAYVLKNVVHNYSDEKIIEILSSIRQANKDRKNSSITLFLIELIVLPEGALSNWQTYGIDIIMAAVFDHARERTADEFKDLLEKCGFQFQKLYPVQALYSVIEGTLFVQ